MKNSILEQGKVAEQNVILRFLKKLKLHSKLVPDTVYQVFTSKYICDYLYITIIY